jgi:hypothetical protein
LSDKKILIKEWLYYEIMQERKYRDLTGEFRKNKMGNYV